MSKSARLIGETHSVRQLLNSLPAPTGSNQDNNDSAVFKAPGAGEVVSCFLATTVATATSDSTNQYQYTLRNATDNVNLSATLDNTADDGELSNTTSTVVTVDQNLAFDANDEFVFRINLKDDGGPGPTDLSSANLSVQVNYRIY